MITDNPVNEMIGFCNTIFLKSITATFLFI
jgi:hypothetical protein